MSNFKKIENDKINCLIRSTELNDAGMEKLKQFIQKYAKNTNWDLKATKEEVSKRLCATGGLDYEISDYETLSGHPEICYFEEADFVWNKDKIENIFNSHEDFEGACND